MLINGSEYVTKEEATERCQAFAAANPGTTFHNYAHSKSVRTADNRSTLYEWNKVYKGEAKAHPEVKGLWKGPVK